MDSSFHLTWWTLNTLSPKQNGHHFADSMHFCEKNYRKTSNISHTLVGNKIVDNSDVD